ncbi:hypothetical protein SESBI_44339 [Sesbania bispinosa]|nr:hypothetical protein SESBI_44339 [Sesbania bispinosa]
MKYSLSSGAIGVVKADQEAARSSYRDSLKVRRKNWSDSKVEEGKTPAENLSLLCRARPKRRFLREDPSPQKN